jgi:hypothetical protein
MLRKGVIALLIVATSTVAWAHLCHDYMFVKDKLVVKPNIKGGQLRIDKTASFKVYVVNTFELDIFAIKMAVKSAQFDATVKPGPTWRRYPYLRSLGRGGKKQHFTVTLKRKPKVPDGKYKISLVFYHGKKRSQVFRVVDLEKALDTCKLKKSPGIKIDGKAEEKEWGESGLCSNLRVWVRTNRPWKGMSDLRPAPHQCRLRLSWDDDYLYCLLRAPEVKGATADRAVLYVAPGMESTRKQLVTVTLDRLSGKVTCSKGQTGIETKASKDKAVIECRIPRKLLGIKGAKSFCANLVRTTSAGGKKLVAYWRGNPYTVHKPVVYARFSIEK